MVRVMQQEQELQAFREETEGLVDSESFGLAIELYEMRLRNRDNYAVLVNKVSSLLCHQSREEETQYVLKKIFLAGLRQKLKFAPNEGEMPPFEVFKERWEKAHSLLKYYLETDR